MAKFEKGHEKKGGRKKGSKNKTTLLGKETISNYFENGGLDDLLADIAEIEDPYQRVTAKTKLIEYYMPKQRESTHKHEMANNILELNLVKPKQNLPTSENDLYDDD